MVFHSKNLAGKEEILCNFYDENEIKILNLLWDKPMSLEEISNSLQINSEEVYKTLSRLEKECVINKRAEYSQKEVYYAAISKERAIELCEVALKDSSKLLSQLEVEADEDMRRRLKEFARRAQLG